MRKAYRLVLAGIVGVLAVAGGTKAIAVTSQPRYDVGVALRMEPPILSPTETTATLVITAVNYGEGVGLFPVITDVIPAPLTIIGAPCPVEDDCWVAPEWYVGMRSGKSSPGLNSWAELRIKVNVPLSVGAQYPPQPVLRDCATLTALYGTLNGGKDGDPTNDRMCITVARSKG